eukprot:jgi/Tetstr1/437277/TSEL_026006.t1
MVDRRPTTGRPTTKQAPQEVTTTTTMEINIPEEQQKAEVGAALDAPRGGKTQLPKIRSAITAEQIAVTRLPPAARPRLTDGQRPPRREEQAPLETTTTTNMNINRPEEHQAAESRQPLIDLPLDTDCATQVALLFGNPATRNRAIQPPKIRSAIQQAPQETTTTANKNINIPKEHQAAEVGATIDASRSGKAEPPKTPKIATAHHPAPHTADQSAMHHGQLPQELQPPPTTQLQVAHDAAAAAPQATEMDIDNSPPAVAQSATGADPAPHSEPAPPAAAQAPTATRETLEASNPSSIPPHPAHQPRRPAWPSSRQRLIAPAASRAGRPPCSRGWIVCGGSAGEAPNTKLDARLRLSAPPPKNSGRF